MLLCGCGLSSALGDRPVATFESPATDGKTDRKIAVYFKVVDADYSRTDVSLEYSADGGPWTPMTLVSTTAGKARQGRVADLHATPEGVVCAVVWDSWADLVGETGDASVVLRLVPKDIDGEGEAVELSVPITVNNRLPILSVNTASVAFTTDLYAMAIAGLRDPPQISFNVVNLGLGGTTLSWTSSIAYAPANPTTRSVK